MFRGEFPFRVDKKGRMSIPADFRRVLEAGDPNYTKGLRPKFVVVYGDEKQKHLEAYTIREANALAEKINRLPSNNLKRRLIHENISCSFENEIDPDGRLVIPARYREKIGLEDEATFVGTLGTFQIWAPEAYAEHLRAEKEEDLGPDIPEGMNPLDALDMVLAQREGV
ncbi:MAG: division/cell wall cluster transcriptional repressor MraZ [Marinibacterium sp.]